MLWLSKPKAARALIEEISIQKSWEHDIAYVTILHCFEIWQTATQQYCKISNDMKHPYPELAAFRLHGVLLWGKQDFTNCSYKPGVRKLESDHFTSTSAKLWNSTHTEDQISSWNLYFSLYRLPLAILYVFSQVTWAMCQPKGGNVIYVINYIVYHIQHVVDHLLKYTIGN